MIDLGIGSEAARSLQRPAPGGPVAARAEPLPAAEDGRREFIEVVGARTNNLRDVSVRIPKGRLVAFTGVSGSGKTSLAVDTLHSEAQLRYLEGLSPFVRQYITQRNRPRVDRIFGLGATLAVDQRRVNRNPRSTVATMTGIDGHLGLLYSRLPGLGAAPDATGADGPLTTSHFDRDTPEGGCADCHGVGGRWQAQEDLVITRPELPLFDGASHWYAKWRSGEHGFIPVLAEKRGVRLSDPWRSLPEEFRRCVLYGTGEEKIEATIEVPNRNESARMAYTSSQPLRGALAEVERVFANAQTANARQRYLRYMRKRPCDACGGSGYGRAARSVRLGGFSYPDLSAAAVGQVGEWAARVAAELDARDQLVGGPLLADLRRRLDVLERLGLTHLQLSRGAATLSGGELQRTRLAAQLSTELSDLTFVLDEPGAGLHPVDKAHLLDIALELRAAGNTVLLVEHDPELIARADWVIDLGPGAGSLGGEVLVSGTPADVAAHPESPTGRQLAGQGRGPRRVRREVGDDTGWLRLHDLRAHNVTADLIRVPVGRLTCLTGVSGSGKSSLLGALAAGVQAALTGAATDVVRAVTGLEGFGWVAVADQEPLGRTPRSNPATYSKAFDVVRRLFAETDAARALGLDASWFSFNTADGGRCRTCTGYGRKLVDMHFLPDVWVVCDACDGRRYTPEALRVRYAGLAVDEVLELTVADAADRLRESRQLTDILESLLRVGLGYLRLGQSATELSGGEAQRLKLAGAIQRGATSRTAGLVVLDEPAAGLHPSDVGRVVAALDALVDSGNTVVVAEHDIPVAASADWLIDLGPGAGPAGGAVVAAGTPEVVAAADTPTAGFLRRHAAGLPLLPSRAGTSR
ncbi:excinuclease ABC subunit A [Actinoalloteichus hoggarensis]|uniref:UvrABC system protein A n=1 Tax=Actinoalloteichus hoggarensis TaxID=1470176 RepID=A0A221VYS6_9PSEU|nr:excinuclease ABC subunit UvrA [Actinoalloteichus hoggarensis]ASO18657.1 UvrABC system protein A [Actinoalloteichus hoggarensis]MBB5919888.1 excinuclease ABC subunit A [Actinoalloteichus hoggarensis]